MEIWKDIPWYEWQYQVSNLWNVKSLDRYNLKRFIKWIDKKQLKDRYWYMVVSLNHRIKLVHRLVAITFIPNQNNLPQVNHIDWNKLNNNISNLEWCTCKDNIKHAISLWLFNKWNNQQKKQVVCFNIKWNQVWIFNSILEASIFTWVDKWSVSSICRWRWKQSWWYSFKLLNPTLTPQTTNP